jgi:hypothetical protein
MSLSRFWKKIQSNLESGGSSQEGRQLAEIRHDILDEIRAQIQELSAGRFLFPYNHILIELRPGSPGERAAIEASWIRRGELQSEIYAALAREDCEYPDNMLAEVKFREGSADSESNRDFWLTLDNSQPYPPAQDSIAPGSQLCLTVITGEAEPSSLDLSNARTNLGRLREVFDQDGQFVRHNDVAFADLKNGVNETVGRTHAHIAMQKDGRFALINSRHTDKTPTAIIRSGQSIPVILLPEPIERGDIIQLGRANIRVT